MSTDRETPAPELGPDLDPPELTDGAARVLLRILRQAHDARLTTPADSPDSGDERDVA
jgi:hypothetical protein